MSRQAKFTIMLGEPGSGKSTLVEEIIGESKQPTLVVDPDGEEDIWMAWDEIDIMSTGAASELRTFKDKRMTIYEEKVTFEKLVKNYRNGNLVLDDCRCYVDAGVEDNMMLLLRRKRQYGLDVFAMAHGFTEVPPKFFTFATHYILFSTEDEASRVKRNIPNYEDFMAVKEHVDHKALDDPHYYVIIDKKQLKAGAYKRYRTTTVA